MAEKLTNAFISLFCFFFACLLLYALHHYSNTPAETFSLKCAAFCWLISALLQAVIALLTGFKNKNKKITDELL